jgi:hypothetical protein
MGLAKEDIVGAMRFSWCHRTQEPDWKTMVEKLKKS